MRTTSRHVRRIGRRAVEVTARVVRDLLPPRAAVIARQEFEIVGRLDYEGCDVRLHADSEVEWSVRLHSCSKEPETVRWLENSLRADDVLFDVGANIGAYALLAAKLHQGRVRVVAFEPSASNFAQLVRNVSLNECDGVVTAFAVALDAETRVTTFRYRDLRSGYALHAMGMDPGGAPSFMPVASQAVLAFRLDDFIRQFGLPSPTHMKIDVDGPELSVLRGAVETLSRATVRSVLIEVDHDRATCGDVFDLMNSLQFTVTERHQSVAPSRPGLVGAVNCVFEKRREAL